MSAHLLVRLLWILAGTPVVRPAPAPSASEIAVPERTPEGEFDLGQRHYARGEYRQAAESFTRAAARLEPARKPEARYWAGLSWLGAGESTQARAAFEDVVDTGGSRAPLAKLGIALCWEADRRADRAEEALARLVVSEMGEAGPAALSHLAALARARGDTERARRAQERLLREYADSMEAAEARLGAAEAPAGRVSLWVQIGAFGDPENAKTLAERAKRAGLGEASLRRPGEAGQGLHLVLIGPYRSDEEARRAAAQASERLSVAARVARMP